ncbi:MAG: HPF/RaiA family ribosome-associated protein [Phycisphaerales bacterium]
MQIPVMVAFEGVPESDAVQQAVQRHAQELEHFFNRITSCRVAIVKPHRHGQQGALYEVKIDLTVPGHEIVVSREHRFHHAHEDVYVAMRDAFRAARRQLEEYVDRRRGDVKRRTGALRGRIVRVPPKSDFGFIAADDGREIYFHRNAIVNGEFAHLQPGDRVSFSEELGEQGPQATSIHVARQRRGDRTAASSELPG